MARKPSVTRALLQETALELFLLHGYDAVKVSDICEACGTTKPTFYHYVSSKDDLLVTYYDDVISRLANPSEPERLYEAAARPFPSHRSMSYIPNVNNLSARNN